MGAWEHLPSIEHVSLQAHVVRSHVFNAPLAILDSNAIFIHAQRFVALADQKFIRFLHTRRIWCYNKTWPQRILVAQIWKLVLSNLEQCVNPVQVCLQIQIVPKAVTVDESEGFWWLASTKRLTEAHNLIVGNGVAHNDLNCWNMLEDSQ